MSNRIFTRPALERIVTPADERRQKRTAIIALVAIAIIILAIIFS